MKKLIERDSARGDGSKRLSIPPYSGPMNGPRVSGSVFRSLRDIIYSASGIYLSERKISLLEGRLNKRLRELKLASFDEYLDFLKNGKNEEEIVQMLNCISTNETSFFREPHQYQFLETHVFPQIKNDAAHGRRARTIRVWSAACSTGDELYSAAMLLLNHFPTSEGWTIDALGTDISLRVLNIALQGVWPIERARGIAPELLKRYMLKGTGENEGKMIAGQALREVVKFKRFNLFTDTCLEQKACDIIFCRNVMIYFDQPSKLTVINKLIDCLSPGGYFFVGHAETLHGLDQRLNRHIPTVYSRKS